MEVQSVLNNEKSKFKSTEVEKAIPLEYDLGNLAAFDTNPIDPKSLKKNKEEFLKQLTRDNTQLIMNAIFNLPTKSSEDGVFAVLPEPVTVIPREKPVPKEKILTRWEKFAKAKGIQKKKRSRFEFDEETGEYKARYGYDHTKSKEDVPDDWLIEVPRNADPMEDQYEKRANEKKERIESNKKRQKRNLEEAEAIRKNINPREARKQELLNKSIIAKTSTASLGRFDKQLKNEPKVKNQGVRKHRDSNTGDMKAEKEKTLEILEKTIGKKK